MRRSPFAALALAVIAAGACSVYGPGDLVGPDSGPFAPRSGGEGGRPSPMTFGGSTFGGTFSGGSSSASGGKSKASGGAPGVGGSSATGGAKASGGQTGGGSGGSTNRGGSTATGGGSASSGTSSGTGGAKASEGGGRGGGSSTGGSSTGGSSTGGSSTGGVPLNPELLDNMEDGNAYILQSEGRDGVWYTAFGEDGSAQPPPSAVTMAALEGDVGVPGSKRGFHFVGDGGSDWGALCAFELIYVPANMPKLPYDAAKYKGIKFWAKAAAETSIVVRLPLKDTTTDAGGKCTETAGACENHFNAGAELGAEWTEISLLWDAFSQEPWGYTLPKFDAKQLVAVQFLVPKGEQAEFWIDDVSFIP